MALRNVTGILKDPSGNLLPNYLVRFIRKAVTGQDGFVIMPDVIQAYSNALAEIDVDLYSGNYIGEVYASNGGNDRVLFKFAIALTETGSTDLAAIISEEIIPVTNPAIAMVIAARDEAVAAADVAQIAADALMDATQFSPFQFNAPGLINSSATASKTVFSGGSHRHFGGIVRDLTGQYHIFHRKSANHPVSSPGTIAYAVLAPDGTIVSAERDIVASTSGIDHRDPCVQIMPNGRIVVNYTDTPTSGAENPVLFLSIYSDDNGATWSNPVTMKTTNGARLYGTPKVVRQNDGQVALLQTCYYGTTAGVARTISVLKSLDYGETWTELSPLYTGSDVYLNEAEIEPITADYWIAVCRYDIGHFRHFYTTDGGATWTGPTFTAWGTNDDVSPSLNSFYSNGKRYIALSYCDRDADTTVVRWASAEALLTSADPFAENVWIGSSDMQFASGYQKGVVLDSGVIAFIEYRENGDYTLGPITTDVRLFHVPIAAYASEYITTWTPTIAGKTTAGTPVYAGRGGTVVKRGKTVHVTGWINLSSKGGMAGELQIGGLPFTVANENASRASMNCSFWTGVNLPNREHPMGFAVQNTKTVDLYLPALAGVTPMLDTHALDTLNIYFSMTYKSKW